MLRHRPVRATPPVAGPPPWSAALRALREAAGMTQAGWAARVGYGRTTVQRWERGEAVPDAAAEAAIIALCEERGVLHSGERGPLAQMATVETIRAQLAAARVGSGTDLAPPAAVVRLPVRPPQPETIARPGGRGAFVGRASELGRLRGALRAARAGDGRLVLLAGEPGIGKTRLAWELADEADEGGWLVLWGRGWEGDGAPAFWPWVEALGAHARALDGETLRRALGDAAADIATLIPEIGAALPDLPPSPAAGPEQARFRLFGGLVVLLTAIVQTRSLLLVLDDLHWADAPSLLLLQFLARRVGDQGKHEGEGRRGGLPLLVIGGIRDTEVDERDPRAAALAALRRESAVEQIGLGGLSSDDVAALLEGRTGQALDAGGRALADGLRRETEGNPLFVEEMLRHLIETGGVVQEGGRWRMTAAALAGLGIPDGVRAVIGRRLARLSDRCRAMLAIAAVMGREFDAGVLERVGGWEADDLDAALAEAAAATIVAEPPSAAGPHRFTHALVRETLLRGLPVRRRARLHRQVAEALEDEAGVRVDRQAAALAYHFGEAAGIDRGAAAKAVRYGRLAGERAQATTAWEEAVRHYERCLAIMAEAGDALGEDEAALVAATGACRLWMGEPWEAQRSLRRAINLYRERGDGVGLARVTLVALNVIYEDEGERLADEALALLDERDRYLAAQLLVARAGLGFDDDPAQAAQRARTIATADGYADVLALVGFRDAQRLWSDGEMEEAIAAARAAFRDLVAYGQGSALVVRASAILNCISGCVAMTGRLDEAAAAAREQRDYSRRVQRRWYEWHGRTWLAMIGVARGDTAALDALLEEGIDTFFLRFPRARLAERRGDPGGALDLVTTTTTAAFLEAAQRAAVARLHFEAGDNDAAHAALDQALAMREVPTYFMSSRLPMLTELDQALPALGSDYQVAAAYAESATYAQLRCDWVSIVSLDRVRGALALRLGRLDEAEALYRTAIAWAERERCPVELGRSLHGLAEAAARRGCGDEARTHLDRAAELFQRYGAPLFLRQAMAARETLDG